MTFFEVDLRVGIDTVLDGTVFFPATGLFEAEVLSVETFFVSSFFTILSVLATFGFESDFRILGLALTDDDKGVSLTADGVF